MAIYQYLIYRRQMKESILNKIIFKVLGILLFVIIWQVLSVTIGEQTFIFPGPFVTTKEAIKLLSESYIYKCLYQTIIRMIGGFAIAFGLAFILGVLAGNNRKIELLFEPSMTILRSVPTATLVYLFLVLAGARLTPMLIVVLVAFPILYESIVAGIKSTPTDLIEAATLESPSKLSIIFRIKLPLAIPYIIVGIVTSFALSLKIEIMAEVITGYTRLGLGSAILAVQRNDPTNMVPVFAYSLVAIVLMLIFDVISNLVKAKLEQ